MGQLALGLQQLAGRLLQVRTGAGPRHLAHLSRLATPITIVPDNEDEEPEPEAGAAWKCRNLTELRW